MRTSKSVATPVNGVAVQLMCLPFSEAIPLHGLNVGSACNWIRCFRGAKLHMPHVFVDSATISRNYREAMEFSICIATLVQVGKFALISANSYNLWSWPSVEEWNALF